MEYTDDAPELPNGWSTAIDSASGNTYYYNAESGESSWEAPRIELVPCTFCTRRFAPHAIARHSAVCKGNVHKPQAPPPTTDGRTDHLGRRIKSESPTSGRTASPPDSLRKSSAQSRPSRSPPSRPTSSGGGSKQEQILRIISAFEAKLNKLEGVIKDATEECQDLRQILSTV
jgi:hypothetical protein